MPHESRIRPRSRAPASAPEFRRIDLCWVPRQGESSASRRQTCTYGSYIPTMKHWWRYASTCSWIACTTAGGVDVVAAVDVPDAGAVGARDHERRRRDPARDVPLARLLDALRGAALL